MIFYSQYLLIFYFQIGDPKDAVRNNVRALLKQIWSVYPLSKLFVYLMDGIKSKNARQRAGSYCWIHYFRWLSLNRIKWAEPQLINSSHTQVSGLVLLKLEITCTHHRQQILLNWTIPEVKFIDVLTGRALLPYTCGEKNYSGTFHVANWHRFQLAAPNPFIKRALYKNVYVWQYECFVQPQIMKIFVVSYIFF